MTHKKKQRPSLLTRSSKSTIRRTTSHLVASSTAGSQEPKRWEASSAATCLGRLGDTGATTASREAFLHQLLLSGRGPYRALVLYNAHGPNIVACLIPAPLTSRPFLHSHHLL